MTFQQKVLAATIALMFSASAAVMASESETEILVSGDEPMNVDNAAEVSDPAPSAVERAATQDQILVSGDEPMNVDNAAEVSDPTPNAVEQAATQEQMDKVEAADGAISGKDN